MTCFDTFSSARQNFYWGLSCSRCTCSLLVVPEQRFLECQLRNIMGRISAFLQGIPQKVVFALSAAQQGKNQCFFNLFSARAQLWGRIVVPCLWCQAQAAKKDMASTQPPETGAMQSVGAARRAINALTKGNDEKNIEDRRVQQRLTRGVPALKNMDII